MRKAIDTYLRKNKSVENVLESMDEHIVAILTACIFATFILYIETPFSTYIHEFIGYIQPEHFQLM
jgi:hypothetical protein